MTPSCRVTPDELRTLFLFEALTDEQLAMLCGNGHIENYQPGPICVEGEPATCFYVLIEGELTMSKLSGGQDIETNRTSQRGVYCGAWRAFTGGKQKSYDASVHVTKPSRFFVMDAPVFAQFMQDQFPMAVHLLDGIAVGTDRTRRIIDNREKLLALGRLSAGLTHQLNNPAAAIARAADELRGRIAGMRPETGDARRRHRHPGDAERPGAAAGGGRRASRQVGIAAPERDRDRRPRGRRRRVAGRPRHRRRMGHRTDIRRRRHRHRLAGADFRDCRRIGRVDFVGGGDPLDQLHHRKRTADEPDFRSEQTDFGAGRRRQTVFPDGPGPVPGGRRARTAAQHAGDVRRPIGQRRQQGPRSRSQWSRNSTNRFPKSLAIQAISTRYGPTSSTTRSPRCATRAAR